MTLRRILGLALILAVAGLVIRVRSGQSHADDSAGGDL
jgi:hypothetical protein